MNQESNNDRTPVERAKECIFDQFEQAWHQNPDYRVEDHLPLISPIAHRFGVDGEKAEFKIPVVVELIRIEISLRRGANEDVFRFEYERRFPELEKLFQEEFDESDSRDIVATVTYTSGMRARDLANGQPDDRNERVPKELGPFTEIVKIGSGGFGVVCRSIDSRIHKPVALKFPRKKVLQSKEKLDLFLVEAERVMKLDHPGIVKTHSIEHFDGHPVIVMQLIVGSDLKTTLTDQRSHQQIAELIASIADALEYAHLQGIIHRDLKPANILLDESGRPLVADFGLAIDEEEQFCAPNQICGTVPYMSTQLAAGLVRNLDGRTDIWSLGVILYELLVGKRPFRGLTVGDILQDIETKDPKPPRQYDKGISKELQRICLRCLEKKAKDRYSSADELANDLRHWIRAGDKVAKRGPDFVPKGLRSYDASDSEFFLDLLPGPRDRDNIPGSIRFWTSRIREPVPEEDRVPVGVIYGPSGSGKSSFVKAGLLPKLKQDLCTIYVESTRADTEVRLINRLRNNFNEIPQDIDIPEIFRGLSQGQWHSSGQKILIVLDQFEQRLSMADDFDQSQLAKALRHCDGARLQCLLLVRDDFWLALTRFFDALELDLLEGQNSQAIDLFDCKHAGKILTKLGRAYEQLPAQRDELTKKSESFVKEAVSQMSSDNYVICVRLILFAEMFKQRPWTLAELRQVGGVAGTGEKFLEAMFGPNSRDKHLRMQREPASRVLEALLPEVGTDIRGTMKSKKELMVACELEAKPDRFADLIKSLDGRLKLITGTDPDISKTYDSHCSADKSDTTWYQLTHDYLIPSIRDWILRKKRSSRIGRVELNLIEKASNWSRDSGWRQLLSPWESLNATYFRPKLSLNNHQHRFLQASNQHNAMVAGITVLLVGAFIFSAVLFVTQLNERQNKIAKKTVDSLLGASNSIQIINDLDELERIGDRSKQELLDRTRSEGLTSRQTALIRLALLRLGDHSYVADLYERLLESEPDEFRLIIDSFAWSNFRSGGQMWQVANDGSKANGRRLRAICYLAATDPENDRWDLSSVPLTGLLMDMPFEESKEWLEMLAPFHEKLVSNLELAIQSQQTISSNELTDDAGLDKQAMAAILLFRLGEKSDLLHCLANREDPTIRTFIIHSPYNRFLEDDDIIGEMQRNNASPDVLAAFTLILGYRNHREKLTEEFTEWLVETCSDHQNSGLFSCAMWMLGYCRLDDQLEKLLNQVPAIEVQQAERSFRDVFGHRFVTIGFEFDDSLIAYKNHVSDIDKQSRLLAICATEETIEIAAKWPGLDISKTNPDQPITSLSSDQILRYCNWLSEESGLPPEEFCYKENIRGEMICRQDFVLLKGYRLPLQVEWSFACAGGSEEKMYFGRSPKHMQFYAWFERNSEGRMWPVGQLNPSAYGLFDTYGNCWEWCHVADENNNFGFKMYGGSWMNLASAIGAKKGNTFVDNKIPKGFDLGGFRLVRTLSSGQGTVNPN